MLRKCARYGERKGLFVIEISVIVGEVELKKWMTEDVKIWRAELWWRLIEPKRFAGQRSARELLYWRCRWVHFELCLTPRAML